MSSSHINEPDAVNASVELFDVDRFAFLLDVDGTLLDIACTPQGVTVPPDLPRDLEQLNALAGGAVALVSGRTLDDLDNLFGPLALTMIGGHGAERRTWRNGRLHETRDPPLGAELRRRVADVATIDSRLLAEDKGYSVALHFRLAPEKERAVREAIAALKPILEASRLEILHGKAVIEIRRPGVDKGAAISALMHEAPFRGRRPLYIGDDATDDDAFVVLPEFQGIAIFVGPEREGALRRFDSPAEVRRWLAALDRHYNRRTASVT
jgi:trehalose 6-phosphate phosphatase